MDVGELRKALTAALKARDSVAVAALRSALAAIDNASAVDPTRPRGPTQARSPGRSAGWAQARSRDGRPNPTRSARSWP